MKKIQKSSFKRNLLIGFGMSLMILIASSVSSFISIRNLLSGADWVNHTNVVIANLESILSNLKDAETNQRGFLLTQDQAFLDDYGNAYAETLNSLRSVKELTADNQVQQDNCAKLKGLLDVRIGILQQFIEVKKKGKALSNEELMEGRDAMKNVGELIQQMKQEEKQLLVTRTETMQKFAQITPLLIVLGAILALVITIIFYTQIKQDFEKRVLLQRELEIQDESIRGRIDIIENIATKISSGNYAIRIDDQQKDALGGVAGSLNTMAKSLEYSFGLLSDKEWLQTGIANLNDLMIGEKSLPILTNDVISFVTHYTSGQAGTFYVWNEQWLERTSGYGVIQDTRRERIALNDGLVGQSAVSRKAILLENISAEDMTISFATGDLKPKNILIVPIYDGPALRGVIELASLQIFSIRAQEFLSNISQNIGVAISTAQNQRRLKELLDETQSQSEELQAQHNEMENMNAELEAQTEKLQASEEELKVQQEELLQANQEMEERTKLVEEKNILITERNIEIQSKAEELEQSTRYKSEFLANMSHELRTPLNSILLLSRLMAENDDGNLSTDQVEYARVIQSSGRGLLSLIDEILDLSKIEAGKMELEYAPIATDEMVKSITSLFAPVAKDKNVEFRTSVSPDVPEKIESDRLRLDQIIRNLISNALKFTQKGVVSMDVSISPTNSSFFIITIKDTGIGIPKEKQQMIFDAFQQADGSTRRQYGGTGLGLSISRELVKLLGGEIKLKSEVGKGSEFSVHLPISRQVKNNITSIVSEEHPEAKKELPQNIKKYISTTIPENIPDDRNSIAVGDKVILIVEDDTNFAKSLLDYTRKEGYKGIVAVRGDEGIELAKKFMPLGILLDIQLPIKSGWEVMTDLKNNSGTRHIPVHIMSSHSVKNESLLQGAVDFIKKPLAFEKMNEIFQKIEYVLNHHPKKVLIVEENAKHAKALAYFLETFDVSLEIKNSVAEGIAALKNDAVDCVILDMGVPDQKAYDTLDEVKKTPGLENIPIIIFTGKSLSKAEEARIKQYADSIVVKTAHSYQRIVDEVGLFLHLMEKNAPGTTPKKSNKMGALNEILQNKTVLIVDDDVRNIFSLTKALENYKMKVITAIDGKDALQQLKDNPGVDIVLMDMMMPEMDGYETTTLLRKDPKYKKLPIIAVTAKAMMGDRARCINAGASDYITKPVDADQLLSLLRVWLYEN